MKVLSRILKKICNERNINVIPVTSREIEQTKHLPDIHRDPFDRLIIAQAKSNGFVAITSDKNFKLYLENVVEY